MAFRRGDRDVHIRPASASCTLSYSIAVKDEEEDSSVERERERHIFWRKLFFTDPPSTPRVLSAPLRSTRVSYYVKVTPLVHPGTAAQWTLTRSLFRHTRATDWPDLAPVVFSPLSPATIEARRLEVSPRAGREHVARLQSVSACDGLQERDREGLRVEVPESPIPIILGIGDIGRELTGKLEVTSQIQRACLRLPPLGLASLAEWRASCERAAHLGCWCRTSR